MTTGAPDGYVRLLAADPELAAGISPAELSAIEDVLIARVIEVERGGTWLPGVDGDRPAEVLALVVLSGWVFREVAVANVGAGELLGAGDLCSAAADGAHDFALPRATTTWQALTDCRLAIIDAEFMVRAKACSAVLSALTRRAFSRSDDLARQSAITNRQRVDQRLLLLFAHLARRHGRVTVEGVRVDVPLTHELLARLVGAHRPSVSAAMSRLARNRRLVRLARGSWLIRRASVQDVAAIVPARALRLVAGVQRATEAPAEARLSPGGTGGDAA